MSFDLKGVCPVIAVPFDESGEIDIESFKNLVNWLISIDTRNVLFFGVGSENIKLSDAERLILLENLLHLSKHTNMKVIASVADHSAELAVKKARKYQSVGVDAINILPPTFFSPSPPQIQKHITCIIESVEIPVIVQHLPQASSSVVLEELIELSKIYENFRYIKCESNPPEESVRKVIEQSGGKLGAIVGWGGINWASGIEAGAVAVQPGCAVTDLYLWAEESLNQSNKQEFQKRLDSFLPFITRWIGDLEKLIKVEKRILKSRGIIKSDYCRMPTVDLDPENLREIDELLLVLKALEISSK